MANILKAYELEKGVFGRLTVEAKCSIDNGAVERVDIIDHDRPVIMSLDSKTFTELQEVFNDIQLPKVEIKDDREECLKLVERLTKDIGCLMSPVSFGREREEKLASVGAALTALREKLGGD